MNASFENIMRKHQKDYHPVVPFHPGKEKLSGIDLTADNVEVTEEVFNDTEAFTFYIEKKRKDNKARYLVGGYNELRALYGRSELFSGEPGGSIEPEPRRLHLGIDVWGQVGTKVHAPLAGKVHSFAFNHHYGDYGATVVLSHELDGFSFYTLYGHLALKDIETLKEGKHVTHGAPFGHFGEPNENGHWPPHLHFQIILDMGSKKGDYPGVCRYSEKEKYLRNCPDPDLILQMRKWIQ